MNHFVNFVVLGYLLGFLSSFIWATTCDIFVKIFILFAKHNLRYNSVLLKVIVIPIFVLTQRLLASVYLLRMTRNSKMKIW